MASFADRARARMASITSNPMPESWDDDFADDLLFKVSTAASLSSRMSVRSESNTGEDDSWQVLITPDNAPSTAQAVSNAAQRAGIPIPSGVPSSALLGGSIKRLGKKKSSRKIAVDDDWGNDIDLGSAMGGLKLKAPKTPAEESDDFDWGESSLNSLGIRFAGSRARGSSVSAMSSCIESDDDDLSGLILPEKPLDFNARLEKLKKTEYLPTPDSSPFQQLRKSPRTSAPTSAFAQAGPSSPTAFKTPSPLQSPIREIRSGSAPKPPRVEEDDFADLDFGAENILTLKRNRNVVVKDPKPAPPPAARATSTLTFTNQNSSSRIPRPLPATKTRLQPVYETGASTQRHSRPMPTTTSAQLLKSKRSAPILRNTNTPHPRPLPSSSNQTHHVTTRASQPHLRRESDPRRPQSPAMRTYSRLSGETPSRAGNRKEMNPSALARHPPPRKITTPQRKQAFGNGHELDRFDDLPTSAAKEKPFVKMPSNKSLRQQPSSSRLPMPDRMQTPLPETPRSPPSIPRFAQDTVASRQRLAGTRSRADGPIAPRPMSWAAQVAARSPHASPNAHRKKGSGQQPRLIRQMTSPVATTEQGMVYNPTLQTWQGNEEILMSFNHPNTSTTTLALTTASTPTFVPHGHPLNRTHDRSHSISHTALANIQASQKNMSFSSRAARLSSARAPQAPAAPVPSPPRPALISQISAPRTIQVEGKMFYDPIKMTWLKAARRSNDPMSPSEMEDDEDPFAGMDDLKDDASLAGNNAGGVGSAELDPIMEAYDVGPGFIRRQRDEEVIWRRKVDGWIGGIRDEGNARGGWRWLLRDMATSAGVSSY